MSMVVCAAGIILFHIFRKQPRANTNNQDTREQTQPRNDILRCEALCHEHDDSECYDAEGVRKGNDKPKEYCVNYPSFRTDEVSGDDGFSVSGC